METAGQNHQVCISHDCSAIKRRSNESDEQFLERQELIQNISQIRHKILVLSGKGGVGKSTVAVHLANALSQESKKVGLLDVDIHGPSIPTMLGVENKVVMPSRKTGQIVPVQITENLIAMSIGFLLPDRDDALIWRGPRKYGLIKQFLKDVEWGELDYLIIDLPPGTGDEPLAIAQMIENVDGAVVVTTPQEVALADVRKSITFCKSLELPVLGVIENMSGFICPECGKTTCIFKQGGAEQMCRDLHLAYAGSIPLQPDIAQHGDEGSFSGNHTVSELFKPVVKNLIQELKMNSKK